MANLRITLPLGFLLPFILIIGFEYLVNFGLGFYNERLNATISSLESNLKQKEQELNQMLKENESFYVFSQFVNIAEIARERRSVNFIIDKFNRVMPKFLAIEEFKFDADKNEIEFKGKVNNWVDYVRLHEYITSLPYFMLKELKSPKFDEKENIIEFSMVLFLKPEFYKQE